MVAEACGTLSTTEYHSTWRNLCKWGVLWSLVVLFSPWDDGRISKIDRIKKARPRAGESCGESLAREQCKQRLEEIVLSACKARQTDNS